MSAAGVPTAGLPTSGGETTALPTPTPSGDVLGIPPRLSARERDRALLGSAPTLTMREFAARAGVTPQTAARYWRASGLPLPGGGEVAFTEDDVAALRDLARLVQEHQLDPATVFTLARSTGHTMERLVLWQAEAMIGDLVDRDGFDPVLARLELLRELPEIAPVLETQLLHAWRRQLAIAATRYEEEFTAATDSAGDHLELRLARAVGFADIVQFTQRTAGFTAIELARFVQEFEATARDIVVGRGGRVVKTIGDAVLFVADDPATGAEVALALAEAPRRLGEPGMPVRVSVVWGHVLSRFGDVFGETVNLSARLVDLAEPSTVRTDDQTVAALGRTARAHEFTFTAFPPVEVQGFGPVRTAEIHRA